MNGPWTFDKSLLVLEVPRSNQRTTELSFKKVPFWIMLINLPMGFRNELAVGKIGKELGDFIEMDKGK